ncbi:MAG TPA: helix-turn-helix domain-containing protein [Acidobacteriota bacterium]|nr:helix-turn-helix domain-containing protein [Acidobacteriota bacterium]
MPTDPVNDFVVSTIRRIRIEKGIKVETMSKHTGIPLGSYSCLETGRYRMSLENLFRILHVLGTDIHQVWPGEITTWAHVDEEFIREWIAKARARQPPMIELEDIIEAVCATYDVTPEDLCSPSRKRILAEARMVAAVLVKETAYLALVDLSRILKRDVSSLSHSLKRAHNRMFWDRLLRLRIRAARRRLNNLLRAKSRRHKEE